MNTDQYARALSYLYGFTDYEKRTSYNPDEVWDLGRMDALLKLLGDPHKRFRSVHIAGTKGKGSTAAMVESMLRAGGIRTGLFTSPHLHTFRERIQALGDMIGHDEVIEFVGVLESAAAQVPGITTFELITALAFLYFARRGVEVAVLEVGLGGRLDATNVIQPSITIITSLSYDHTHLLGHHLTDIAREKAGIIKPGTHVLSANQPLRALHIIEEVCQEKGSPLFVVGREMHWKAGPADLDGQFFGVHLDMLTSDESSEPAGNGWWVPLLGEHQLTNATLAVAAVKLLNLELGTRAVSEAQMRSGLRRVEWPGRLEILGEHPYLVVDGAHNADSGGKLVAGLQRHFDFENLILVFGASLDKDIPGMFRHLLPESSAIIFANAQHPRAMAASELAYKARVYLETYLETQLEAGKPLIYESTDVDYALEEALQLAGDRDLICATGSLFLAAEIREAWARRQGLPEPETDPPL